MGISRRQGRNRRTARGCAHPRTGGGTGHNREGALSRAIHLCFAYLRRISPFDAALCMPPLGRRAATAPSCGTEMGETPRSYGRHPRLSDARSRLATHSHAARSFVKTFWGCQGGTTAIEYTMIAFLISIVIIA